MNTNCKTLTNMCKPTTADHPALAPKSPAFSVCVGAGALLWDGNALHWQQGAVIPDGEYTQFTVRNGCIIGASDAPIPVYTPPPCVDVPAPCDGGTATVVSPVGGNLTTQTPLGIYTQLFTQAGGGVSVTGTGVAGDPLVISASTGGGQTFTATTADIGIDTLAPGVIGIGLNPSGLPAGTYNGLTFSSSGIATAFSPTSSSGVTSVLGVAEVDATTTSGVVSVSLKPTTAGSNTFTLGGHTIVLTQGGLVDTLTQAVNITAGDYTLGAYTVSLSDSGEITNIVRSVTLVAGTFTTTDGKTISYDEFGTITQVV